MIGMSHATFHVDEGQDNCAVIVIGNACLSLHGSNRAIRALGEKIIAEADRNESEKPSIMPPPAWHEANDDARAQACANAFDPFKDLARDPDHAERSALAAFTDDELAVAVPKCSECDQPARVDANGKSLGLCSNHMPF